MIVSAVAAATEGDEQKYFQVVDTPSLDFLDLLGGERPFRNERC